MEKLKIPMIFETTKKCFEKNISTKNISTKNFNMHFITTQKAIKSRISISYDWSNPWCVVTPMDVVVIVVAVAVAVVLY